MLDLEQLMAERGHESLELNEKHINPVFAKVLRVLGYDNHYVRGEGQYLWDDQGKRYLDCLAGFGVFSCGRNHPNIRRVIQQAMDMNLPNLPKFGPPKLSGFLAEKLVELAPGELDTVFFCNSGAETVEAAMKYARAATGRDRIVYCKKGYHGLTMGTLSINGGGEFRDGFGPLLQDVTEIPFNDLEALKHELAKEDVAGFVVEPIQGKGVFVPDDEYLPEAQALCQKHGTMLIADEVQTGFGRTGKMFACEHWGVEPDLLCVSKALSGGYVPVGALLSKRWIHKKVFSDMSRVVVHSTTFSQNDLAMAAGLAVIDTLQNEKIIENAAEKGEKLIAGLRGLIDEFDMLKEVRGKGLMIALDFGSPKSLKLKVGWKLLHTVDKGLFPQSILIPLLKDHGVYALVAGHHMDTIKLLPSLVINDEDVEHLIASHRSTIAACHKFPGPTWEITKRLSKHMLTSGRSKKKKATA